MTNPLPHHGHAADFAESVLDGLSREPKSLSSAWLYDERGSELFEEITELPEYYPTRTEIALLREYAGEMAEAIGPEAALVEFGSGSSRKTPIVLAALDRPAVYVPLDISRSSLLAAVEALRGPFPDLPMVPIVGDFTGPVTLPADLPWHSRRAGFFPGSTIGNLHAHQAVAFLERARHALGPAAVMVVGIDLDKSTDILIPAYDDAAGVTAEFNLNLLHRLNRELGGDLEVSAFRHEARYHPDPARIEMHLVSLRAQRATVAGRSFEFAAGETIHTENSHKYTLEGFAGLAGQAGWRTGPHWMDPGALFAIQMLFA